MAVKKAQKTVSINGSGGDREKTLELALAQIEKAFGRGAVMRMGEAGETDGIKTVSTGSIALDLALGVGGLPRGRIVEIFGAESAGKTTLAMAAVAEAQAAGGQQELVR